MLPFREWLVPPAGSVRAIVCLCVRAIGVPIYSNGVRREVETHQKSVSDTFSCSARMRAIGGVGAAEEGEGAAHGTPLRSLLGLVLLAVVVVVVVVRFELTVRCEGEEDRRERSEGPVTPGGDATPLHGAVDVVVWWDWYSDRAMGFGLLA